MNSMIELLRAIPLFAGVSHQRMQQIVGESRLHFLKFIPGETILTPGQTSSRVSIIISGSVRSTITNGDSRFAIAQTLGVNTVLAPSYLFGRHPISPARVVAIDSVGIMQIEKTDYMQLMREDEVFLYNFLNILSTNGQKAVEGILALTTGTIRQRLALWVICLTQPTAQDVTIRAKTRDLYTIFGAQRSLFIATLDEMAAEGILTYTPREIHFLDRRGLDEMVHATFGDSQA